MISRWQDVARKAAEKLGVDEESYLQYIEDWGQAIQSHASKPKVMQTDMFGVGYLKASYGKIKKELDTLRVKLGIRQRRLARYADRDLSVQQPMIDLIMNVEADIQTLERFVEEKYNTLEAGITKRELEEKYREEHGTYKTRQKEAAALKRAEKLKVKEEKAAITAEKKRIKNEKRLQKLAAAAARDARREARIAKLKIKSNGNQ